MKSLVFILVLANLLFYAFSAGYFGHPENPDAGRLEQQVTPERIHLVASGEAPAAKPPEAQPAAAESEPDKSSVAESTCLRWDQLSAENARLLVTRIGEQFSAYKVLKHTVAGESTGWWVYIPAQASKADAEKKAGELRQLGVTDYFIIPDEGPNRFAISLGVFSSEKGGQERLADLKAKGVKSARFSPRPGKESFIALEARGPLADKPALTKMAASTLPKTPSQDCK